MEKAHIHFFNSKLQALTLSGSFHFPSSAVSALWKPLLMKRSARHSFSDIGMAIYNLCSSFGTESESSTWEVLEFPEFEKPVRPNSSHECICQNFKGHQIAVALGEPNRTETNQEQHEPKPNMNRTEPILLANKPKPNQTGSPHWVFCEITRVSIPIKCLMKIPWKNHNFWCLKRTISHQITIEAQIFSASSLTPLRQVTSACMGRGEPDNPDWCIHACTDRLTHRIYNNIVIKSN